MFNLMAPDFTLFQSRSLTNDPDDQLRTWAQEQLKLLEANP
jgi:hypothetical protein